MAEPELTKAPIRVMEAAIIARLRLAFPEKKFQIARVPAVLTVKEFERIVRLKPFIGLAGWAFSRIGTTAACCRALPTGGLSRS
ncbi:hypothetical protein HGG75_10330 [Ochrobactrum pseudogrignonense]|nr:hypothetical protein [Brucella pseudogrignonensis]